MIANVSCESFRLTPVLMSWIALVKNTSGKHLEGMGRGVRGNCYSRRVSHMQCTES